MKIDTITYPVSEIFTSIQGEGNYVGVNALFIRFHFCNLRCIWCDTKYTWTAKDTYINYSLSELKQVIDEASEHHIILTGGEPLLHSIDKLGKSKKHIHIESNGYYIPTDDLSVTLLDGTTVVRKGMDKSVISEFNWVISPKLTNSRQPINKVSLRYWAEQSYAVFKFIVRHSSDINEIREVITEFNIDPVKVYLGVEGAETESQLNTKLVEEIIQAGFNFSPRLHVLFWGNKRGK